MTQASPSLLKPILWAGSGVVVVASFGAFITQIGPWYYSLAKPSWQPPDWLFGPVWTLIFLLAAASFVLSWRAAQSRVAQISIISVSVLNMLMNSGWSALFFYFQRPDLALAEVGFLWASILLVVITFWRFSHVASFLMLPYLAWVSFASYLNYTIVRLNPQFH